MERKIACKITQIDRSRFERAIKHGTPFGSVARMMGISDSTLRRWCSEEYGKTATQVVMELTEQGNDELRAIGDELSERYPAVWIFLAKNRLGLSDNPLPPADDDAKDSLSNSFKIAAKSISSLANLASVPDKDEEGV